MKTRAVVLIVAIVAAMLPAVTPVLGQEPLSPTAVVQTSVVRVYYPDLATANQLFLAFEPWLLETNYEAGYHVMQVSQTEIDRLTALGLRVEPDPSLAAPQAQASPLGAGITTIPGYSCYRTVEETYTSAQALATARPDLAAWIDVGDSWEKATVTSPDYPGYDLMVLKLTNSAVAGPKPKLFVTAELHAREYATSELVMRFAEYLVNNYGSDPDVTWILDHHEVHLMFMANPDGRKKAEAGSSWRKNTDRDDGCSSSYGVDLNRNFNYQWGGAGSSSDPCNETYRGPSAASEPEVQVVQAYIDSLFPDQRGPNTGDPAPADATGVYLDIHSYGRLVLWPWAYTGSTTANATQFQTLGRKFAFFNAYTPGQWYSGLYPSSGAEIDYAYGKLGIAAIEFEVGTSFFQDCTYFTNTLLPANQPALLYAAKVPRTPYITPSGPDTLSLALSTNNVPSGTPVTLTGSVNDTRYGGSGEPTQNIAAAEYYIDTPPWLSGTPYAMAASDGSFGASTEGVTATINTSGLSTGKHILLVRGKDASGNWGAISAIFLTITAPPSQPPVADPQSLTTAEDTSLAVTLTGSDPEGAPLTFAVQTGPSHGSLTGTAPDLTYTPAANYNGSDAFAFVVNDGQQNSAPATVSIDVTPVNDAPLAQPQSVVTVLDTALAILLTGSDVDGDALSYAVVAQPAHGALSGTPPSLTYLPAPGYTGEDGFSFTAGDGTLTSPPAVVSITVNPPGPVTVFLDDFESDLGWVRNAYGTDTATLGAWERANPEGVDYYGWKQLDTTESGSNDLVTGPLAGSSAGSYDLDGGVTSMRSPAIALPSGGELEMSFSYYLAHYTNSTTDDYLRVSVVGASTVTLFEERGAADDDDAAWATFSGSLDAFAGQTVYVLIEAADAGTASLLEAAVDDVRIEATNPNQPPTANPQSVTTAEDTALAITLTGSDPEGSPLTYAVQSGPSHGTFSGTAPDLTYTPAANYQGLDSLTFVVNDGQANSAPATVSITVSPVNDAPVAADDAYGTEEETTLTVAAPGVLGNDSDADGDSLTPILVTDVGHGDLELGVDGSFSYTPAQGYFGPDSFSYTASDGALDSNVATVNLTVSEFNEEPVAAADNYSTDEDTPLYVAAPGILGNDTDGDGDTLSAVLVGDVSHGNLALGADGSLSYTPAPNYWGTDGFTYRASDGQGTSEIASVTLTVNATNDAPVANPQSVTAAEDTPKAIVLSGSDADGDALSFGILDQPVHGTLTGTGASYTYAADANYNGPDSFTFKVSDGTLDSAAAIVSITVTPVNDPPVGGDDSAQTDEDSPVGVSVLSNDTDVDGDPLDVISVTQPAHGTAVLNPNDTVSYTPNADYCGGEAFTYTVSDGNGGSDTAPVEIMVACVNDAPVASPQSVSTQQDTAAAITLTGSDVDGDTLTYSIVTQPVHGTLSGTPPNLTYMPAVGYTGADSLTFAVSDGSLTSAPATVSIMVNAAGPLLYLGSSTSGTAGGVSFADEDILVLNQGAGAWALYIDGSDVGLANTDVDALGLLTDGSLLMSFDTAFTLSGFGAVDDSDVLRFVPTSTGPTTAGSWQWYFDGSDVGLSTNDEDVDACDILPDGRLVISTLGAFSVTGASGQDEDLIAFTPSLLGSTTAGTWALYFDGSDVGLSNTSNEDINGVWVDAAGRIYLTTLGAFSVTGVSGDGSDLFVCTPGTLGNTTTCTWAMYWDGSANGFSGEDTDSVYLLQ